MRDYYLALLVRRLLNLNRFFGVDLALRRLTNFGDFFFVDTYGFIWSDFLLIWEGTFTKEP